MSAAAARCLTNGRQYTLDLSIHRPYHPVMPDRSRKPPAAPNALARFIVDQVTAEADKAPEKNPAAVALGRLGGLKGGKARAESLSPKKRSEIARKAASARWRRAKP